MPLRGATFDENYVPSWQACCGKIGRASLLASHRPSKSLAHEARREPRPPGPESGFSKELWHDA